mmetsp:Transcript_60101/g.178199  ORF Transcript_60101/g.178199 Transcript_60101/m.178199 type:complete len:203 (-) Transcript_60101:435-1043(-)|eukprot:CAMPEP_0113530324 /NCGR_PEP_ID=MMETSP0015_2-20120614/2874_1 /TAXON_ID=2838 /ORGANISM="Odontella" /LENGTH=202 /DNA_ID=CAMNT_0000429029 /DNA_START=187 /DNA_END=795 /DNA_ORIENTATION=+ /assembly_acc=CAM_ASM_000160
MLPRTFLLATAAALAAPSSAFAPATFAPRRAMSKIVAGSSSSETSTSLSAIPDPSSLSDALQSAASFSSIHLSTIDADIDSIPTDQFGLVFAGGITVMLGGLASALAVGAILEGGNNYANVIADSYVQGGDESFWESLTPEEREETEKLLKKVKESKGEDGESSGSEEAAVSGAVTPEPEIVVTSAKKSEKSTEERSMFSDY